MLDLRHRAQAACASGIVGTPPRDAARFRDRPADHWRGHPRIVDARPQLDDRFDEARNFLGTAVRPTQDRHGQASPEHAGGLAMIGDGRPG